MNSSHSLALVLSCAFALSIGACAKPDATANASPRPAVVAPSANAAQQAPRPQQAQQAPTNGTNAPSTAQQAPAQQAQPSQQPSAQDPALAGIPSAFDTNGQRRTCAQMEPRAGYDCVETPNGPTQVLSHAAAADVDPCATATCLPNTRCQAQSVEIGGTTHRLPRCVATGTIENVLPSRDPCVSYLCPLGYRCRAPADRPACVPESAGW